MWHVWISSLGVTAAIILAGGYVALQILRERHHFQLMRAALEQGMTDFATSPVPSWMVSMRQAVAVFILGIGLLIVGGVAWAVGARVEPPKQADLVAPRAELAQSVETPAPAPAPAAGPKPGKRERPPGPAHHPPKPPPNPALERWHLAQQEQTIGMAVAGCGFLITLLGAVRIGFAVVERRHFSANRPTRTEVS